MAKKNAIVTRKRGVNHGEDHFPHGAVIRDMDAGQFKDWEAIGIVREATAAELATDTPPKRAKPATAEQATE